jgi:hypothetical protein
VVAALYQTWFGVVTLAYFNKFFCLSKNIKIIAGFRYVFDILFIELIV